MLMAALHLLLSLVLPWLLAPVEAYNYTRAIDIAPPVMKGDEWDTSNHQTYLIQMPGARPRKDDDYQRYSEKFKIDEPMYITSFAPQVFEVCHHVILSLIKKGREEIVWAWANHGSAFTMPKPIAYVIRPGDSWHMTMHYKRAEKEEDYSGIKMTLLSHSKLKNEGLNHIYPAKVVLLAAGRMRQVKSDEVKPKEKGQKGIREFQKTEWVATASHVHPHDEDSYIFAYRTHAHLMGTLIEGFRYHGEEETKIASRSPQQPQTFVRFEAEGDSRHWTVKKGDKLQNFCYYDEFRTFGQEFSKEMCNLYLMTHTIPNK